MLTLCEQALLRVRPPGRSDSCADSAGLRASMTREKPSEKPGEKPGEAAAVDLHL
jgi:hypothetical protein